MTTDHGGIRERDEGKKRMPRPMAILFLGLILFGLVYMYRYTPQLSGWSQADQYERLVKEREAAATGQPGTDIHPETEHGQLMAAEKGKEIYLAECAACHGDAMEGGIGPSLKGPRFKYGATLPDHIRIITKGTDQGMPGFEQLGDQKIKNVAAYIHTAHRH